MRPKKTLLLSAVVLSLAPVAFARSTSAAAQTQNAKPVKATIGLAITDSTFLPIYIAESRGFFKKEGLDATVTTFRGGSDLTRAVVAGAVDIGISSPTAVLSAIRARQRMKVFFGGFNMMPFSWYAVKSIKSLAEAKGKRFGISRFGSATDALTRYLLRIHHMNANDVKIVQGGASSARLAAMDSGQLDVGIFAIPFNYIAAEHGYNLIARQSDLMPDFPIQSFFASQTFIDAHPKTIKSVLRAFILSVRYIKSHKAEAVNELVKKVRLKPSYAGKAYDDLISGWRADGRLASPGGMKAFFTMAIASHDVRSRWPKNRYWDDRFVSTINQWKPK